jgi:hypothetical protein
MAARRQYDGIGILLLGVCALLTVTVAIAWGIRPPPAAEDIDAQTSMAWAAWAMVAVSAASLAVGGLTIYLVFETLRETRRAADAADLSALHGEQAIKVTRDNGMAQIRAYVTMSGATFEIDHITDEAVLRLTLTNSGQTPAQQLSVTYNILVEKRAANGWSLIDNPVGHEFLPPLAGGKDDIVFQTLGRVTQQFSTDLLGGLVRISVEGNVKYRTIFDWTRPDQFRFRTKQNFAPTYGTVSKLARIADLTSDTI